MWSGVKPFWKKRGGEDWRTFVSQRTAYTRWTSVTARKCFVRQRSRASGSRRRKKSAAKVRSAWEINHFLLTSENTQQIYFHSLSISLSSFKFKEFNSLTTLINSCSLTSSSSHLLVLLSSLLLLAFRELPVPVPAIILAQKQSWWAELFSFVHFFFLSHTFSLPFVFFIFRTRALAFGLAFLSTMSLATL